MRSDLAAQVKHPIHQQQERYKEDYLKWLQIVEQEGTVGSGLAERIANLTGWRYAYRAYDPVLFQRIMKWNGLLSEEDLARGAMIPEYAVAVCGYDCIAFYHRAGMATGGSGPLSIARELPLPEGGPEADRLARRLARTAVRAVYALGLDWGLVRLALAPRGRLAVRGVDPFPAADLRLAGKFAAELLAQSAAAAAPPGAGTNDVLVGLDVEFVLADSRGALVPADRFLPRSGPAGHDACLYDGRVTPALAELRPAPSGEPRQLFANLRRAMQLAAQRISDPALRWLAGASPVAGLYTGGHIHLSGVPLTFELLRTFDNYLALPLALLEDARSLVRRPVFGWLGNARRKHHGGFEYRTPSSWLVSPAVTQATLVLAMLIARHYTELHRRPLNQLRLQKAYYEGDRPQLRSFLPAWREDLQKLSSYRIYEDVLQPFFRLLDAGWHWDEAADIREAWSLSIPLTSMSLSQRSGQLRMPSRITT